MTGQAPLEGELRLRVIRTPAGPLVCCLCTAEPAFHEPDGTLRRDGAAAAVVRMAAHARACTDPGAARLPGELPLRITHTGAGLQIRCPCGTAAGVTQAGPGPGTPAAVRPAALARMVAHLSACRRAHASASAGPPAPRPRQPPAAPAPAPAPRPAQLLLFPGPRGGPGRGRPARLLGRPAS